MASRTQANDDRVGSVEAVGDAAFRLLTSGGGGDSALVRYRILHLPTTGADQARVDDPLTASTRAGTLSWDPEGGVLDLVREGGEPLRVRITDGRIEVTLTPEERLYGMGDASRDTVQRRGQRLDTWVRNVASYAPVPFVMSSAGWGLMINSTRRTVFDLGAEDPDLLTVSGADCVDDLVLFAGPTMVDVLEQYTALAGRPTLLPLSAYGLTYVCNQQANSRDMLDEALRMREHDIPCDIIGLEPGWMETRYDYTTEKKWDPGRFYIPEWMLEPAENRNWGDGKAHTFLGALDRLNFKLSLWLCCDYDLSHEAERRALQPGAVVSHDRGTDEVSDDDVERDKLLNSVVMMDKITKPEEPWFEHLKQFVDYGAAAFKLDGANQVMDHPDRLWGNGMLDDEMHNLYPVLLSQQMYEGFVEHTGRRPLIYSACGYTGTPQFAATWAGDTGGGPRPLVSMLNHGLSGHSNTSCDMDVFTPQGIHFGLLQPWSQICSWAYWRQPWLLGERLEGIFRYYAKLRYRLLPYLYSTAWTAHRSGLPILRAMPLAFPDDVACHESLTQYMLGDAFLVGAFVDDVHLPAGEWIDFWTGRHHVGPESLVADVPDDRGGPLFVKAGALVPTWPEASHAGISPVTIGLDYYPGPSSHFTLYEDDGETTAYASGAHSLTEIHAETVGDSISITIEPRLGDYATMPDQRCYEVRVHSRGDYQTLTVNGEAQQWTVEDGNVLTVTVSEHGQRTEPVRIGVTSSAD